MRAIPNPEDDFNGKNISPVGPRPMGPSGADNPPHLAVQEQLAQIFGSMVTMHSSIGADSQTRPTYLDPNGLWAAPQGDGGLIVYQYQQVTQEDGSLVDRDVEVWRIDAEGQIEIAGAGSGVAYGYCATAAATAAKIGVSADFKREVGSTVALTFSVANTAANATLDVNATGASPIRINGAATTASDGAITAGMTALFQWDGVYWNLLNAAPATIATPVSVANGGTGATTAAAALSNLGITYSTTDLTPGSSALATGAIRLVYE